MKHTPGPWEWRQSRGNNIYEHFVTSQRQIIAELNPPAYVKTSNQTDIAENIKANARLIASAPEMLAALKAVRESLKQNVYECGHPGTWATELDDMLAEVLAKAEGRK